MGTMFRDSIRSWRKARGVAAVATVSLALGIGATTTFYALVDHLLLRTLPVFEPHRLALLTTEELPHVSRITFPVWQQIAARTRVYDGAFAWVSESFNVAPHGDVQTVQGVLASGSAFRTLHVGAAIGRLFDERDDAREGGADGLVAVISYSYWQRGFGGASDVVGRRLTVEGVPFTIVGVTPQSLHGFRVGDSFDVVLPLNAEPQVRREFSRVINGRLPFLRVMMRLPPGRSVE